MSEKFDCTVLFMYLLTVSIKRPGMDFLKKSIKQPVLYFFKLKSLEQPGLIIENLEFIYQKIESFMHSTNIQIFC